MNHRCLVPSVDPADGSSPMDTPAMGRTRDALLRGCFTAETRRYARVRR